ncbi:hypothetical protein [Escherichia coli]|uniref:hypothetical protein n=1 Tax=Escherichia coli TaxID=562 RepID=UPI00259CABF5|nr:hypothetical protein [Escherichia coli]MDM5023104.1 hypothetical protein [Escherichia coli]
MEKTVNSDLHLGQYWRIDIVCDPELRDEVEQYFSRHDVGFSKIEVFSVENPYKLALFFDFAKKGVEVAKAIMGLLDRNDIEITMYRATDSSPQSVKSIKLRKSEDVEKCKDLLREGANKRGNSSRLTQSFHFFMFEPIFSPVNALNQPI